MNPIANSIMGLFLTIIILVHHLVWATPPITPSDDQWNQEGGAFGAGCTK